MKRLFLLIILLVSIFSCIRREPKTIICGQIDGYNEKQVHIFSAESIYNEKPYGKSFASTYTNGSGQFYVILGSIKKGYYHIVTDEGEVVVETPIAISPGDSIHVATSIFNTSQPRFGGSNESINNYIVELRQSLSIAFRSSRINQLSEDQFTNYADSIEKYYASKIDSILKLQNKDEFGVDILLAELETSIATKRFDYLRNYNYETQAIWKYYTPDDGFYLFSNGLIDRTSKYWFLQGFPLLVEALIEDQYQKTTLTQDTTRHSFEVKLEIIDKNYDGVAKEVSLCRLAKRFPEYLSAPDFFTNLNIADSLMKIESSKLSLSEYFNDQKNRVLALKPGVDAPNFSLPDRNGVSVSLQSFRGKVVLLVFWGTWCPPCLSSIPKYISIQNQFAGDEVAFVFVSLEARASDVEGWRDFIEGKGDLAADVLNGKTFPGIHLIARRQFQNSEIQPYAITYAPSYILIDKEGQIALPRAVIDDELVKRIEELLAK